MKNLLNIGVSILYEDALNRKIRISNLISIITIFFMMGFIPLAISFNIYSVAALNLTFLLLSVSNFFLHYKKLHNISFYISCIFGPIYFTASTIIYGLQANTHLFLIIMSMISVVLFDNLFILKIYNAAVIFIFFFLIMYMKDRAGLVHLTPEMQKVQGIVDITNVFSLFFITLIFLLFFKRDNTRFQKLILEQKKIVQEKQKEIIDSITYAKRIQEAILPPQQYWLKNLPNSFVLYKPKDIVAGDFYWMETFEEGTQKYLFFAAADCTGHGVPGAMVSVVCNNALNRSLLEFKLTDTGKILDKTRELVIETFGKSDKEVKDGMDISLCRLDLKTNELQWSGANNPLWYTRNGTITEIKPDKQPIGNYSDQKPFTAHFLQLQKNDIIYLFTDGYADQFGGAKGKKFKYKQLEEKLLSISETDLNKQKELMDRVFEEWKDNLEQIDDVCLIGIRI